MLQPRTSWEQFEREVEAENEREQEALRRFYARERQPMKVPLRRARLWQLFWLSFGLTVALLWLLMR